MATLEERFQARQPVLARLGRVDANGVPLPNPMMEEIAPDLHRIIGEACFGFLWSRPALSMEQRSLATISIIVVLRRDDNLRGHVESGLDIGLTPEQIVEIVIQLIYYAGAPIATTAMRIVYDVFKDRGITVNPYRVFDPTEDPEDLYRRGLAKRREVLGGDGVGSQNLDAIDSEWDRYLLEYVWGSVWTRPGLDLQSRCICALTASTLVGTEDTVRDHIRAALRLGLSESQIRELFFQLTFYIGFPIAQRMGAIAKEVFASR